MGGALEQSHGLAYLDKESILQGGDVLTVTTDLINVKDKLYESPIKQGPDNSFSSPTTIT